MLDKIVKYEHIENADDPRVAFFRMKGRRDHLLWSKINRQMLDKSSNYVVAITQKVVRRALSGRCAVVCLLTTKWALEQVVDDLNNSTNSVDSIYLAEKCLIEDVIGLELNHVNVIAAIVDVPPYSSLTIGVTTTDNDDTINENKMHQIDASHITSSADHLLWASAVNVSSVTKKCVQQNSTTSDIPDSIAKSYLTNKGHWFGVPPEDLTGISDVELPPSIKSARTERWASGLSTPLLIFDDVRSADNLGVIMRTAFSLGIQSAILTKTSFKGINSRCARVSLGALFHFTISYSENIIEALHALKRQNITILGTSPTSEKIIESRSSRNWALIIGNENEGSSKEVMDVCDEVLTIPQVSGDSLSVSTAVGICVYELSRHNLVNQRYQLTAAGRYFTPDI